MAETKQNDQNSPLAAPAPDDAKRIKDLETQLAKANAKADEVADLKTQLAEASAKAEQVDALAAKLEEVQGQVAAAAKKTSKAEATAFHEVRNDAKVKIKIMNGEGASGRKPVFTCVNGLEFMVPRDMEVEVPRCVYKNLLNSVAPDPGDGHDVQSLNIQVII